MSVPHRSRLGVSTYMVALWLGSYCTATTVSGWSEPGYTVQKGDALHGIACTLSALGDRNGLDLKYHVYAGERLIIPTVDNAQPESEATLSLTVRRAIDRAKVRPGRWKHIVIHHSGVVSGTIEAMDRYHREERHMPNGLAYHFVIGNGKGMADGQTSVGERWTKQLDGGHLASENLNRVSLGICLVGNFDKHKPTQRQMQQLTALVRALLTRCELPIGAVTTHQQMHRCHTRCPGKYFPTSAWLKAVMMPITRPQSKQRPEME